MRRGDDLDKLTALVADQVEIDWREAETMVSADDLENLRIIDLMARFHRRRPPVAQGRADQATWGHLQLRERIGQGSFGEVYRAWDPSLEREVALKLLHPGADEEQLRKAILNEGRLLAKIRHENVVTVHGVAENGGMVGFWMEFAVGRTLSEVVATSGPFGCLEASAIGIELCRALAAVHASGVVHRDIKAENVVRETGGRILLVDFGLGSERRRAPEEATELVGTPLYLAPEIVLGTGGHSVQSDLYALGVLLYFLVTGSFPVCAKDWPDLKERHLKEAHLPLLDARPGLPEGFIAAVEKALHPDRSQRFTSAGQFERALAWIALPVRDGRTQTAPHGSRSRAWALSYAVWLLGGVLCLTILTLAIQPRWVSAMGFGFLNRWLPIAADGGSAPDANSEAYRLYQTGRHHWNKRTPEEIRKSITYFKQAIQQDSNLALAYSGLADAYSTLVDYGVMDFSNGFNAIGLAMRAREMAPDRAEAHASVGLVESLFRRRWKTAEGSFRRAIELDPEYAPAYQWYAALLAKVGRPQEAVQVISVGLKHDYLSASLHTIAGWMMLFARDYGQALEQARTSQDLDPYYYYAKVLEARVLSLTGDFQGARRLAETDLVKNTDSPISQVLVACIEAEAGNRKAALALATKLEARRVGEHFAATHLATIYALLGVNDKAFEWLENAYREGDSSILFLRVHPYYDNLRSDPRYERTLEKLELDDNSLAR